MHRESCLSGFPILKIGRSHVLFWFGGLVWFLVGLGFELRVSYLQIRHSTASATLQSILLCAFWTICLGWSPTSNLSILASLAARITGVSHWCPAQEACFKVWDYLSKTIHILISSFFLPPMLKKIRLSPSRPHVGNEHSWQCLRGYHWQGPDLVLVVQQSSGSCLWGDFTSADTHLLLTI
jgi:hypothetical protein